MDITYLRAIVTAILLFSLVVATSAAPGGDKPWRVGPYQLFEVKGDKQLLELLAIHDTGDREIVCDVRNAYSKPLIHAQFILSPVAPPLVKPGAIILNFDAAAKDAIAPGKIFHLNVAKMYLRSHSVHDNHAELYLDQATFLGGITFRGVASGKDHNRWSMKVSNPP